MISFDQQKSIWIGKIALNRKNQFNQKNYSTSVKLSEVNKALVELTSLWRGIKLGLCLEILKLMYCSDDLYQAISNLPLW